MRNYWNVLQRVHSSLFNTHWSACPCPRRCTEWNWVVWQTLHDSQILKYLQSDPLQKIFAGPSYGVWSIGVQNFISNFMESFSEANNQHYNYFIERIVLSVSIIKILLLMDRNVLRCFNLKIFHRELSSYSMPCVKFASFRFSIVIEDWAGYLK